MRMLLLYILLALLGQQTTVNGQQTPFIESENLKNSESEKGCEPRAISNETFLESENLKNSESEKGCEPRAISNEQRFRKAQSSQHEAQSLKKTVDCCPLTVDYFENQIRLADSLYKNYLPQYNFEEVKAAVMFFDSLRLTTDNSQRTTDFLETENLKTSESEKSCEQRAMSNEPFLESEKSVNISEICGNEKTNHKLAQKKSKKVCEQRAMSNETFFESEKSVNISEICGEEKTNHKLVQKKSEKCCEPQAMSNEQKSPNVQGSQHEAQSTSQVFSFSDSQILYFENQIRLADSLYKNYLPQYNFEEVKAAVGFFDSLRLTTDNSQQTTDFLETENLKISESEKGCEPRAMSNEQRFRNAQSSQHEAQSLKKTVDCCPLSVDIEYQRARAHYYHAVGLTERDDIVGACEHYFIALEIMELEIEKLKTSKSGKGSEQRAMSHEQKFRNAHSSKLEVQNTSQFFRGVGMVRATFYIGFTNLVYNMCRLVQIKRYHPDWIIN